MKRFDLGRLRICRVMLRAGENSPHAQGGHLPIACQDRSHERGGLPLHLSWLVGFGFSYPPPISFINSGFYVVFVPPSLFLVLVLILPPLHVCTSSLPPFLACMLVYVLTPPTLLAYGPDPSLAFGPNPYFLLNFESSCPNRPFNMFVG